MAAPVQILAFNAKSNGEYFKVIIYNTKLIGEIKLLKCQWLACLPYFTAWREDQEYHMNIINCWKLNKSLRLLDSM